MSFVQICTVALSFFAVAQATLVINSVDVVGNGTSTIKFTSTSPDTDPSTISIELTNPQFNTQFAVGTNIAVASGAFSFETPQLPPGPDYTIQLISIFNTSNILAQTQPFTIAENDVNSTTTSRSSGTVSSGALSSPTGNSATFTSPPSSQTGGVTSVTQPGSTSNTGSTSAPPSSSSNAVFGGNNSGATGLQASFALGLVGVAFAFL